jgi:hypothetical protein
MADNTTLPGTGEIVSTDQLVTLNGAAVATGEKAQRVKAGFGADGVFRDVSGAFPLPVTMEGDELVSYDGRASSFRMPGRAGTAGQKIFSIFNTAGSGLLVKLEEVHVHLTATVIKAVTVLPPMVRLYRVTAAPTNGTAALKQPKNSSKTSSASVAILFDASADGTASATALTATPVAGALTAQFAARMITAAGFDVISKISLMDGPDEYVVLREGEGVVCVLDYVLATQNPVTDMWIVSADWTEYTAVA